MPVVSSINLSGQGLNAQWSDPIITVVSQSVAVAKDLMPAISSVNLGGQGLNASSQSINLRGQSINCSDQFKLSQ